MTVFALLFMCAVASLASGALIARLSVGLAEREITRLIKEQDQREASLFANTLAQARENTKRQNKSVDQRRKSYQLLSFVFLLPIVFLAQTGTVAFLVGLICFALLALSAIDIDNHYVPDSLIMALAAIGLTGTLVSENTAWTLSFDGILWSVLLLLLLISISINAIKVFSKSPFVGLPFGEGDTLLLIALAFYFGADVFVILLVASGLFLLCNAFKAHYIRMLCLMGHTPASAVGASNEPMAFVPFLALGTLAMFLLASTDTYRFSTSAIELINNLDYLFSL